ncbi:MAG: cysteine synthase A [Clostridiales bacterium]|nr:cysteine synthase A [Candidatus Equinaster intestinalis]
MGKIYNSIDELIGKTPLLRLKNTEKKYGLNVELIAKLEYLNPAGSAKDRIAKKMIDDAEKNGILNPDTVIIEPTSGNTGIGLASVAAARGYKTIIVMPDSMSVERIKIMAAYGAQVVLTDGAKGMAGAIEKAEQLNKEIPDSFIAGQFENDSNPAAHYETTGPEIWNDTDGEIDIFVATIGTGGTITGTGKYLKEKNPNIKIIGVEPSTSNLLSGGKAGSHGIQGIGANFIPKTLDTDIYDEIIAVSTEEAYAFGGELGKNEGFLSGISSGAAIAAAVKVGERKENKGKKIVVLLPDTGDRYLSTELYK